jgi:hypothetical protein
LSAAPLFIIIISQKEYTGNDKKPPLAAFLADRLIVEESRI